MKSYFIEFSGSIIPFSHVTGTEVLSDESGNWVSVYGFFGAADSTNMGRMLVEDEGTRFHSEYTAWLDAKDAKEHAELESLLAVVNTHLASHPHKPDTALWTEEMTDI